MNDSTMSLKQHIKQAQKERLAQIPRIDKRICQANEIASHEDISFSKLTSWAKAHPLIWTSIMRAYLVSPDFRFGDTLLGFCDSVKYKRIDLRS